MVSMIFIFLHGKITQMIINCLHKLIYADWLTLLLAWKKKNKTKQKKKLSEYSGWNYSILFFKQAWFQMKAFFSSYF